MKYEEKINILKSKIENELLPMIDNDYVLWEVPYYTNVGDVLIWEGELAFLRKCKHKCLGMSSGDTCNFPELSKSTIILLQGGGNFGDLWRGVQEFRLKVIEKYPDNKIIMFPQSVHYESPDLMKVDAGKMASHKNLLLCVRDLNSYNILKENFKNKVLLLPDMAFCIDAKQFGKWVQKVGNRTLLLKRCDKEAVEELDLRGELDEYLDIRDWPSIEKPSFMVYLICNIIGFYSRLRYNCHQIKFFSFFIDCISFNVLRPILLKQGIRFVSAYKKVYTTRLHVMILSILLHKQIVCLDNSYGKNSAFYKTWLEDLEDCDLDK